LPDLKARLEEALAGIAGAPVELERPGDTGHGDYATNVALRLAGALRRPPLEIADKIAAAAVEGGLPRPITVTGSYSSRRRLCQDWSP